MKQLSIINNIMSLKRCFRLVIFMLLCVFIPMNASASENQEKISINVENESLLNVLREISKQTGWEVRVDKEITDITVSGHYQNITLEELFRRLLRGKNVSLLIDDEEKKMYVRTFGSKMIDNSTVLISKGSGKFEDLEGMELVHYQQNQEIKRRGQDPDYVDPMIGVSNRELDEILERQNAAIKERGQDPDYIDPVIGVSNAELSRTLKTQNELIKERGQDPDYVDPVIGVRNTELSSTLKTQNELIKKRGQDPDYVDPLIGIPNSVLEETLARQNEAIKNRSSEGMENLD